MHYDSAKIKFRESAVSLNTDMPKIDDKEVQDKLREDFLDKMLVDKEFQGIDKKGLGKFVENIKFQNIATERIDEAQKQITCKVGIKIGANAAADLMYYIAETMLKDFLKPGERVTENNLDEIINRMFESQIIKEEKEITGESDEFLKSIYDSLREQIKEEIGKELKKFKKELAEQSNEMARRIAKEETRYSIQRTDSGELIVKELTNNESQ